MRVCNVSIYDITSWREGRLYGVWDEGRVGIFVLCDCPVSEDQA